VGNEEGEVKVFADALLRASNANTTASPVTGLDFWGFPGIRG